jgi:hypothetical protein
MTDMQISLLQGVSIGLFGLFFGLFEVLTNAFYLLTNNMRFPRIQHGRELPSQVENHVIRHKTIQMLILGFLLLIIAFISILFIPQLFIVGSALIFLNGLLDYGKFRKKDAFLLWSMISFISVGLFVF